MSWLLIGLMQLLILINVTIVLTQTVKTLCLISARYRLSARLVSLRDRIRGLFKFGPEVNQMNPESSTETTTTQRTLI